MISLLDNPGHRRLLACSVALSTAAVPPRCAAAGVEASEEMFFGEIPVVLSATRLK